MNFAAWVFISALLDLPQATTTTTTLAYPSWYSTPACVMHTGETIPECDPGARWTEFIAVTKPGEGKVVCGLLETKRGDDWVIFENRLFCFRGRAHGGTR